MELQTSTMPPKAPRPTIDEDALASQVLEIIGGVTLEALQALEEPQDRDVWLMEEGDDSVFYSDEDQAHQDVKTNTSRDFGASGCEHFVSSVTADEPIHNPGEEFITDKESSEMEKDVTQQVILTEQEEERQELQTPKTGPMDQSDAADRAAQSDQTPEKSVSCRESLQLNCTSADMQTQPEQNTATGKANQPTQEEEVVINAQTPNLEPFDVTNEQSYTRLHGEAEVPEQMSGAQLKISGDRQLQVDQEPQQDRSEVHVPVGFHQNTSPGHCTLPLFKKSGSQESFNHLSSSTKYSTVSYRKIRRGNTRQKIEKFEYMMMNL